MAKRYYKVSEVVAAAFILADSDGTFKPGGTMGNHHMMVSGPDAEGLYTLEGKPTAPGLEARTLRVRPEDSVGYDCGEIWKLPAPSKYKFPIRKALAELKVSQKVLEFSTDDVWTWGHYEQAPDNSVCDTHVGTRAVVFGEVDLVFEQGDGPTSPYQETFRGGGAVAVLETQHEQTVVHRQRRLVRLVVRPGVDKLAVANWLMAEVLAERAKKLGVMA